MSRSLSRALSRSISRVTYGGVHDVAVAADPYSFLDGTPTRWDDFTSLAVDAAVNGRILPGGGGTWLADAGWIGAAGGTCRSNTNGQAVKFGFTHTDVRMRIIWHPGATGDNQVSVYCRDSQSTAFQRWGYLLSTYPAYITPPPTQAIALYRNDNYVFTRLGTGVVDGFYEATINRDYNALEIRAIGSTISGWLNGVKLIEVTDTAYPGPSSRLGFMHTNQSNDGARVSYADFINIEP